MDFKKALTFVFTGMCVAGRRRQYMYACMYNYGKIELSMSIFSAVMQVKN